MVGRVQATGFRGSSRRRRIRIQGPVLVPQAWHRNWRLWLNVQLNHPWLSSGARHFRQLRTAVDDSAPADPGEPPLGIRVLAAASVSFRLLCWMVNRGGAISIPACPSSAGVQLWRSLMPQTIFRSGCRAGLSFFSASHPSRASLVWHHLSASGDCFPCVELVVRPTAIFRSADFVADGS